MDYRDLLKQFVSAAKTVIGERLTGVYLHGSLTMGCFHPEKSDIDLIVVTEGGLPDAQKLELMNRIVDLNRYAPQKGLEVSVVKREYCRPFVCPTPFELHFSPMHLQWFLGDPQGYVADMHGADLDLAAHVTMLQKYGRALCGEPVEAVFASVPRRDYIASICSDIKDAQAQIAENPVYVILNLCRVQAFLQDGLYLSKRDGAEWGKRNLPQEYRALVSEAQACYAAGHDMKVEQAEAERFAEGILEMIRQSFVKIK